MQLSVIRCHLQLNWLFLQLQNGYCIIFGYTIVYVINMQLVLYKMDSCHKNHGLN
jgi:hypothetical protein